MILKSKYDKTIYIYILHGILNVMSIVQVCFFRSLSLILLLLFFCDLFLLRHNTFFIENDGLRIYRTQPIQFPVQVVFSRPTLFQIRIDLSTCN